LIQQLRARNEFEAHHPAVELLRSGKSSTSKATSLFDLNETIPVTSSLDQNI
jgi:hypothetical protein